MTDWNGVTDGYSHLWREGGVWYYVEAGKDDAYPVSDEDAREILSDVYPGTAHPDD